MNDCLSIGVPEAIFRKIRLYTSLAKGEISWIGEVKVCGKTILITDIFLIQQTATPENTRLDDEAYAAFLMQYLEKGGDVADLKLWLHSHGKYSVLWSPRDEITIESYNRADFLVSMVTNKAGNLLARVDIFSPLRVTLNDVPVIRLDDFSPEETKQASTMIESLVSYSEPELKFVRSERRAHELVKTGRYSTSRKRR